MNIIFIILIVLLILHCLFSIRNELVYYKRKGWIYTNDPRWYKYSYNEMVLKFWKWGWE